MQNEPQLENGYTKIANEILERLAHIRIPGEARQVLDVIVRKTYGFNKKTDAISLKQFVDGTGMKKPEVCRALAKLQTMRLTIGEKAKYYKTISTYGLNKKWQEWVPLAKKPTTIGENANAIPKKPLKLRKRPLAKKPPTKEINTKETITKESGAQGAPTPKEKAKQFFKGVQDLVSKTESQEASEVLAFIIALHEKTPTVKKEILWVEIKKFERTWTELNGTGTRERWTLQKTFMVERRLETWFRRCGFKDFTAAGYTSSKGKKIIGLDEDDQYGS